MRYLSLYLDHPKVGCGWRSYLVVKEGRIHARLVYAATGESLTVPKTAITHGRDLPLKPTRMAKRLRAVARTYGLEDSRGVKDALAMLRSVKGARSAPG